MKEIRKQRQFNVNGYPIASLSSNDGSVGFYNGEGYFYLFDRIGRQLGIQKLDPVGFSDAEELEDFVVLTNLSGKSYYSNLNIAKIDILAKVEMPTSWNTKLFFIQNHKLYSWSFKKDFPTWISKFVNVEKIYPCGDLLLVMTTHHWFVMKQNGDFELLTDQVLPFTSASYLPRNNTFHFTLPAGELGLINLNDRLTEPFVTQGSGSGIKILGTSGRDKIAISCYNQLLFMIATSERFDAYSSLVVNNLHQFPLKAFQHQESPHFLIQEDLWNVSVWTPEADDCIWRAVFDSEVCYLKFNQSNFHVGLKSGDIHSFSFSL